MPECPACSKAPVMENISPALAKIAAAHPELRKAIEARLVTVTPDQKCIGISVEGIVAAERERCLAIVQSAVADFLDRKIYIHNGKGFQAACEIIADKIRMSE